MSRYAWTRLGFVADSVLFLALALGFGFEIPVVKGLWPWLEPGISTAFLAGLLASFGAGSLLLARLQEWRAAVGGSLAVAVAFAGFAVSVALEELSGTSTGLLVHSGVLAVAGAIAAGTLCACLKSDPIEARGVPRLLRVLFTVMALLVLLGGIALLMETEGVLPSPLAPQTFLLLGWILIGLSVNFGYVAARGNLAAAQVLLFGLLAYDVVLLVPLLQPLAASESDYWPSAAINFGVAAFTGAVAIYYLFLDSEARLGDT